MLVIVPPSPMAPHAVKADDGGRNALVYPVRHGSDTRWLSEAEIAARYEGRTLGAARRDHSRQEQVAAGLGALSETSGAWLYFAATPDAGVPAVLTRVAVTEAANWLAEQQVCGPVMANLGSFGVAVAGPGRVIITPRDQKDPRALGVPVTSYVELFMAGAFFAAIPVGESAEGDAGAQQVSQFALLDAIFSLVGTGCRWMSRQVGAFGLATAEVGLRVGGLHPLRGLELVTSDVGRLQRVADTRAVRPPASATLSLDLGAAITHQEFLAVTYQAAAALLQHFGVPEPAQFTADGSIAQQHWPRRHLGQVEQWSAANKVPLV